MAQKATLLTIESLAQLTRAHQPPFLSLYQPTHRHQPENRQDLIRFGNLVKELEASLQQKYPTAELAVVADGFAAAKANGLGSDGLAEVAQAASGRVATLLIEADRQIAGRLDGSTGQVEVPDLDDLGELVVKKGVGGSWSFRPTKCRPGRDWLPTIDIEPNTFTKGEHHADPNKHRSQHRTPRIAGR